MKKNRLKNWIDMAGLSIKRIDEKFVLNGQINPAIYITLEKPVIKLGEDVICFDYEESKYIIFEDTLMCIEKQNNDFNMPIWKYINKKVKVTVAERIGCWAEISIDKHGKARITDSSQKAIVGDNILLCIMGLGLAIMGIIHIFKIGM